MIAGFPPFLSWLAVFALGLSLGSFTTCVIYRIPRGLSLWRLQAKTVKDENAQRSFCPVCRHVLALRDLVPVFSWVWQMGRCRYCHARIGWVYPLIEIAVLAGVMGIFYLCGFTVPAFALAFLLPVFAGFWAFFTSAPRS